MCQMMGQPIYCLCSHAEKVKRVEMKWHAAASPSKIILCINTALTGCHHQWIRFFPKIHTPSFSFFFFSFVFLPKNLKIHIFPLLSFFFLEDDGNSPLSLHSKHCPCSAVTYSTHSTHLGQLSSFSIIDQRRQIADYLIQSRPDGAVPLRRECNYTDDIAGS